MDVAVRIDPARPAQHHHLEVAARGFLLQRGVLGGPQRQVEAGLGGHGLDHLGHRRGGGVVAEHDLGLDAVEAGLLEQRARFGHVALGHRELVAVVGAGGRERLLRRFEDAAAGHFVDGVAVDGELERLAHQLVLEGVVLGALAVGDVEHELLEAQAGHRRKGQAGVVLDLRRIGRVQALEQVQVAGAQVRQAHGGIGDRQEGDALEGVVLGVVVLVEFLQHDAVVLDALDELVRTRADRLAADRGHVGVGERLGRQHHAGAVGQLRQQRGVGLLEGQHQRRGVGRLDFLDRGQLALAQAVGQRHGAFQVGLGGGGVELAAVMEQRVFAQLEGQHLVVRVERPRGGQLRHEVQLGIDVHQLVAQRGEDDAADVGAGAVRVQHVRIFLQADADVLGARGAGGQRQHAGAEGHGQAFHCVYSPCGCNARLQGRAAMRDSNARVRNPRPDRHGDCRWRRRSRARCRFRTCAR
ncbi:Uncharacterised protein [Achromobacter xylosoxidans]|nr:Uncharacterised protein [Achromobacter xylosoxidans]